MLNQNNGDATAYDPHGAQLSTGYIAKAFAKTGFGYIKDALGVESEIEVMDLCCEYGRKADAMLRVKVAEGFEVRGVFDYDVAEPFGEWLAKRICEGHGLEGATEELQRRVNAFFEPTPRQG